MTTRAEFTKAIKDFKKQHSGKLKYLLNEELHPETVAEFWANPIIRNYLARPQVLFKGKHPDLQDAFSKKDYDSSDHYELQVYRYLAHEISYRDAEIATDKFYSQGLFRSNVKHNMLLIFEALLKDSTKHNNDVEVRKSEDIYPAAQISMNAEFLKDKLPCKRFTLSPVFGNTYAFALVDIINPSTGSVIARLFMNSALSDAAFKNIRSKFARGSFVDDRQISILQQERMKDFLEKTYSLNFINDSLPKDPTLLVDKNTKSVVTINYDFRDYDTNTFDEFEKSPDVEKIYRVNDKINNRPLGVEILQKAPFIDVSHSLRDIDDDKCSALFAINFIKAIAEMLSNTETANTVYGLASLVKDNNPHAVVALQKVFRDDIKTYLPCYYDNFKSTRSEEAIALYHAKQQWKIGAKSISILHPSSTLPVEGSSSDEEDDLSSAPRCAMM